MTTYWTGQPPTLDDFEDHIPRTIGAVFFDGVTSYGGRWAIMSERSFLKYGHGIGEGRGQKYQCQADGRWKKVDG